MEWAMGSRSPALAIESFRSQPTSINGLVAKRRFQSGLAELVAKEKDGRLGAIIQHGILDHRYWEGGGSAAGGRFLPAP